jgi:protein involved in temperature-dependent protein secretion
MNTNLVITNVTVLNPTKGPTLPFAPVQYDRAYQDTLNNILRQYFNTVDNYTAQLKLGSVYAFTDLPDPILAGVGARAFVTDSSVSTFGTTVAGGGAIKVPVYSDGADWKVG